MNYSQYANPHLSKSFCYQTGLNSLNSLEEDKKKAAFNISNKQNEFKDFYIEDSTTEEELEDEDDGLSVKSSNDDGSRTNTNSINEF